MEVPFYSGFVGQWGHDGQTVGFLKKVMKQMGQSSSEASTIAKLAEGYDNYKIGFKLAK